MASIVTRGRGFFCISNLNGQQFVPVSGTFAKKDYQSFDLNGTEAVKHKLTESQLAEAIAQCNAKSAIATLLAE